MSVRKRLLVVIFDPDLLLHVEAACEDAGFDTTSAWDLVTASALLQVDAFDAVLIHDHPPQIDSAALLRRWSTVPTFVLEPDPLHPFRNELLMQMGAARVMPQLDLPSVLKMLGEAALPKPKPAASVGLRADRKAPKAQAFSD